MECTRLVAGCSMVVSAQSGRATELVARQDPNYHVANKPQSCAAAAKRSNWNRFHLCWK